MCWHENCCYCCQRTKWRHTRQISTRVCDVQNEARWSSGKRRGKTRNATVKIAQSYETNKKAIAWNKHRQDDLKFFGILAIINNWKLNVVHFPVPEKTLPKSRLLVSNLSFQDFQDGHHRAAVEAIVEASISANRKCVKRTVFRKNIEDCCNFNSCCTRPSFIHPLCRKTMQEEAKERQVGQSGRPHAKGATPLSVVCLTYFRPPITV